jgi:hypothetical protein
MFSFLNNIFSQEGYNNNINITNINEKDKLSNIKELKKENILLSTNFTESILEYSNTKEEINLFIRMCINKIIKLYNETLYLVSPIQEYNKLFYTGFHDKNLPKILEFGKHRLILSYTIYDKTLFVIFDEYYQHKTRNDFIDINKLNKLKLNVDNNGSITKFIRDKINKDFIYVTHNV